MTIINCDDCKEYEVINREQAEQITAIDNIVNRNDATTPLSKLIEINELLKAAPPQGGE